MLQIARQNMSLLRGRCELNLFIGGVKLSLIGRGNLQLFKDRFSPLITGANDKTGIKFIAKQIETMQSAWTVAGGCAKASIGRVGTVHSDQQQVPVTVAILAVNAFPFEKVLIVQG